jgi:hypothetical protein
MLLNCNPDALIDAKILAVEDFAPQSSRRVAK